MGLLCRPPPHTHTSTHAHIRRKRIRAHTRAQAVVPVTSCKARPFVVTSTCHTLFCAAAPRWCANRTCSRVGVCASPMPVAGSGPGPHSPRRPSIPQHLLADGEEGSAVAAAPAVGLGVDVTPIAPLTVRVASPPARAVLPYSRVVEGTGLCVSGPVCLCAREHVLARAAVCT